MLPSFAFANLFGQLCFEEQSSFSISNTASTQSPSTSLPSFMALPGDCFGCSDSGDVKKPTHLQLSKSGTNLTLMWEDGGQGACQSTASTGLLDPYKPSVSYTIQQNVNGVWKSQTYQSSRRAFSVHGILGNTYKFRVKACDSQLNKCSPYSAASNQVSFIGLPQAPTLPPSVSSVQSEPSASGFQFKAIVNLTKQHNATHYEVEQYFYHKDEFSRKIKKSTYKSSSSTNNIEFQIVPNRDYFYRYKACSSLGCSNYSPLERSFYRIQPSPAKGLSISYSAQKLKLLWLTLNGGTPWFPEGLTYKISVQKDGINDAIELASNSLSYEYMTTNPGIYRFRVNVCDKAIENNCSGYSFNSNEVEIFKVPDLPVIESLTSSTDHEAFISIQHLEDVVNNYEFKITRNQQIIESKIISNLPTSTGESSLINSTFNVDHNRFYSFHVRACNETGCSAWAEENNYYTLLAPPTPRNLNLQAQGTAINATWSHAPIDPADFQLGVHYEFELLRDGQSVHRATTRENSLSVELENTGDYTFNVRTCDVFNPVNCSQRVDLGYDVTFNPVFDYETTSTETIPNASLPNITAPSVNNIGTIKGQAGVSGGAASYHIPIDLPPGRAGIQPNVSLNYSSRSGNGIAGVGWSLSAGQSITRCPATFAQDRFTQNPQYNGNDKLCLNGQRLVIADGGTYGASGAIYRTEIDSFVRVTQSGGINDEETSFTVEYKNGRTAVFGETAASRVVHDGKTEAYSWLIEYEYDATEQNYINYNYTDYGEGERLLTSINYTADSSSTSGQQSVVFDYQNKDEVRSGYVAGGYYELTQRLHRVVTQYTDGETTNDVNTYTLSYQQSAATSRDLLKSIEQCMGDHCFPATEFSWQHSAQVIKKEHISVASADLIQLNLPVADRNGDGAKDWPGLYITPEGNETTNSHPTNSCNYGSQINCHLQTADVNLDGYSDNINLSTSDSGKTLEVILNNKNGSTTAINTNVQLEELASILSVDDYNGDSFPDVVVVNKFASTTEDKLLIYYHSGDVDAPYSASRRDVLHTLSKDIVTAPYQSQYSVVAASDLNGDGLRDFYVTNGYNRSEPIMGQAPIESLYFTVLNGTRVELNRTGISLNSGHYSNSYGTRTRFYLFADVNGDGLQDWLGWYNPNSSRNTNKLGLFVRYNKGGSFSGAIDTGYTMPERRFSYESYWDSEGMEVNNVMFSPKYANALQVGDIDNDGKDEILYPGSISVEHCITTITNDLFQEGEVCGSDFDSKAYEEIGQGSSRFRSLSDDKDRSIYRYKVIQLTDGVFTRDDSSFYGARNHTALVDGQGDGLLDMVFHYGFRCDSEASTLCNFSTSPPSGLAEGVVNISRNYGSGGGTSSADYAAIDMLQSVTNGVGYQSNWSYRPLSSEVNANINNVSKLYIKGDNYQAGYQNFTSSMYVVNSFEQSDGLGGLRERNYAYRGAVYNSRGRGFMGFKTIVEQDQVSGLVTQTDFRQEFPYQGKIQRQATFKSDSYTKNGAPLSDNDSSAINLSTYSWADNPSHDLSGIYHIYPSSIVKIVNDLDGNLLTTHTTQNTEIDEFGNITNSTVTIDDTDLISYETETVSDYENDEETWFLNQLRSSKVTKTSAGDTKTTSTVLSNYHANRKPETVVLKEGSAEEIDNELKTTTTVFNDYGLPTSITETATTYAIDGSEQESNRTSSIDYTKNGTLVSADGYFPFTVTNAKGHTVTTNINPATGQPTTVRKQIGASAYLDTVYDYDDYNRLYSVQTGGQPIRYTAVQTPDDSAPANAVMQIVTKSAGTPTTKEYKDKLGRTLRTAVQGFANISWIYNDVHYDNEGQVTFESVPFINATSPTTLGVSYSEFDVLGRPKYKVTSQSCANLVDGTMTVEYTYTGFTTEIDVEETCNSLTLPKMLRTYNSQKQLMSTVDAIGGTTTYSYNRLGLPTVIQDANGDSIVASYDSFGRKTSVNDPNQGYTQFTYNGFGELQAEERKQTSASTSAHTIVRYAVDALGRVTKRRATGETDLTYNYDTASNGYGQLGSESGNGVTRTYAFDSFGRPTTTTIAGSSKSYTISTLYDANFGRVKGLRYPNNLTVKYEYNTRGYLTHIKNAASGYVYQNITGMDKFGNIASSTLGNGLRESNLYYAESGQMANKIVNKTGQGQLLNINYSAYDGFGNLRELSVTTGPIGDQHTFSERFEYDDLHRLTSNQIAGITTTSYRYDNVGNITYKSDYATTYDYDTHLIGYSGGGDNAVKKVQKTDGSWVGFSYDARGNMTKGDGLTEALYNAMDKPTSIAKNSITNSFVYGPDHMRFKQTKSTGSTIYYADKLYEEEVKNGETTWRAYIGDVAVVSKSDNGLATIRYTHRDRLGSARLFTDRNGNVEAQRNYDPFGKPREASGGLKVDNKLGDLNTAKTRRGFTDHEHLDDMELIHMNGRVYDYNLGRFMSVDPYVQSPGNSQSINPYSYIMNNPLAGTDPTGYVAIVPVIVWAVNAYAAYETANAAADAYDSYQNGDVSGREVAATVATSALENTVGKKFKVAKAGAQKIRKAFKGDPPSANNQKSQNASNTDGGTKTSNGAENTQSANSPNQKTTDIGSQKSISKEGTSGGDRAGKSFTKKGKQTVIQRNKEQNGGVTKCESCGVETVPAQKSQKGVTPPKNETQVDHIHPKSKGGDGSPSNGQVLCRSCNREKSDKVPEPKKPDEL
ncbi:SpvB/TcaC N-terminal domain-containing protein [Pseudoalteromonas phenolica]|uniref:SpvB/TcaC N-terminal domain-containing protein n=1 Tax=Pseudoalteromonas phenolica TaxID=161398 RepID=UPI001487132D|nr:SpvB/TcaC N-terminal domain-containing protein [Pseudoalteromonas phenolica]